MSLIVIPMQLLRELEVLGRHLIVLNTVRRDGPIGILRLSKELQIPAHKVRYSLRVLANESLVKPTKKGAVVAPKSKEFSRKIKAIARELGGLC